MEPTLSQSANIFEFSLAGDLTQLITACEQHTSWHTTYYSENHSGYLYGYYTNTYLQFTGTEKNFWRCTLTYAKSALNEKSAVDQSIMSFLKSIGGTIQTDQD